MLGELPPQNEPVFEYPEEIDETDRDVIIDDDNPPVFYKPKEVLWLEKWLYRAAIAAIVATIIHTISWIENAVRIAHLQADPDAPDPGPTRGPAGYLHIYVDRFNVEVIEAHRGITREEALAWSHQVNTDLRAALEELPVERVLGGAGRYNARMWFWMPAFIHTRGHRRRVEQRIKIGLT